MECKLNDIGVLPTDIREVWLIGHGWTWGGNCPNCSSDILRHQNYCWHCGQKISWELYKGDK